MKQFHQFQLDTANECLWQNGNRLVLNRKSFLVLETLVANAGRLLTKEELIELVWPDTYVGEENLKLYIWKLRRTLGDDPKTPIFIETHAGRGYRFIAPIREMDAAESSQAVTETARELFDRTGDLHKLEQWFERASSGERQVVFITGEPGIGKTSLTETFLHRCTANHIRIAIGQCIENYHEQEAYYPVLEALGRLCSQPIKQEIVDTLATYGPTWLVQFPSLITPTHREILNREILGATRERMVRELCEVLETLTAEVPLILVLEDLHWADNSTLNVLAAFARRRESARLMLVGTYRPVEVILAQHSLRQLQRELRMHGRCNELALELLSEQGVEDYLRARFPESTIADELTHTMHEQTGGNPLFLITAIDYLVEQEMLHESDGVWQLNVSLRQISSLVPESLLLIIERQIEKLTVEEQEIVSAASIVGVDFSANIVAEAIGKDTFVVEDQLESLANRKLMVRSTGLQEAPNGSISGAFQFVHSSYRQALYQKCGAAARARLHQRIGEALETRWVDQVSEIASELARHFLESHDYERAAKYLQLSADNATRRYAYSEAVEILESACETVVRLPESSRTELEINLWEQLARVYDAQGEKIRAAGLYDQIFERAVQRNRPDVQARTLFNLSRVIMIIDQPRALELSTRAAELSSQHGDQTMQINAEAGAMFLRWSLNGWEQSLEDGYKARIDWLARAGESRYFAHHASYLALLQIMTGDYAGALANGAKCLPLLAQMGDANSSFSVYWVRGWALMCLGQWGDAVNTLQDAINLAERNGDAFDAAFSRMFIVQLHLEALNHFEARDLCQEALPIVRQLPGTFALQRALVMSAQAETGVGNYKRAFEYLSELRQLYESPDIALTWYWKVTFFDALARLEFERGNIVAARENADLMREHADANIERSWQARAREVRARVALVESDYNRAEREINEALSIVDGRHLPLAQWRIYGTAAKLYELTERLELASKYTAMRKTTLLGLANSLTNNDSLRKSLLDNLAEHPD